MLLLCFVKKLPTEVLFTLQAFLKNGRMFTSSKFNQLNLRVRATHQSGAFY